MFVRNKFAKALMNDRQPEDCDPDEIEAFGDFEDDIICSERTDTFEWRRDYDSDPDEGTHEVCEIMQDEFVDCVYLIRCSIDY